MKIYISGPITGLPDRNVEAFSKAEALLLGGQGHPRGVPVQVVNPHSLHTGATDISWEGYMKRDLKALVECDAIFMLKDWETSRGARLERNIAVELGLEVFEYLGSSHFAWYPGVGS